MVKAYVTIMTGAGTSEEVVAAIRGLPQVTQADIVAGQFDVIAVVETESERELLKLITEEIQSLAGVGRTSTCIVLG